MRNFTLHRPTRMTDALRLLDEFGEDGEFYMGGTELLLLMKLGFADPQHLIDGKGIAELKELKISNRSMTIGAGVTHRRLERHPDVRRAFPAMAKMESLIGNVRVRNVGTLGGNLCFAEPHSDPATLLMAMGATVRLSSVRGEREISISEFCNGAFRTALEQGEILTAIKLPLLPDGTYVDYQRLAFKERPTVSAAVVKNQESCRVWIGAVAGKPFRVPRAEEMLANSGFHGLRDARHEVEREVLTQDLKEGSDYRAHLAGVLVSRAWCGAPHKPVRYA